MAEPIEMLFAGWLMGPRNYLLDGGQGRTTLFITARGDNDAVQRCSFSSKILLTTCYYCYYWRRNWPLF